MLIKQFYTGCLSEAAYYIESNGEAAVIDPLRDIDAYLQLSTDNNARIKYIFETHFHADFISGHLDLQRATGAPIIYGPFTETNFPIHRAADGEVFSIGGITLEVLHTPGHTLESVCYLLRDEENKPHAVFTGDTLFAGEVGRPDLSSGGRSSEELASLLYQSLQQKIIPLPDEVLVYPAHGAGSLCGKNPGAQTVSTIGQEKQDNYALQAQSREEFIQAVTDRLADPPAYFAVNARINKEGYESLDRVLGQGLTALEVDDFRKKVDEEDAIILDTRRATRFTGGFVPGSVNIGLEGRFAEWAGSLLPFDKPIVLVTEQGLEKESVVRLARVGFSRVEGFLDGGFDTWKNSGQPIDMIIDVEADELALDLPHDKRLVLVDVRRETEYGDGHVAGALNLPLEELNDPVVVSGFEDDQNIYIHCGTGYRSVIACSLLKRQGFHNLRNVQGGWERIREQPGINLVKENSVLN